MFFAMDLTFPWANAQSKALDAALARASAKPLPPLRGDRYALEGTLPASFKRHSMRNAEGFRLEANAHGQIFGLLEVDGHSSGGFGGSCIPVPALIALLNLWTEQQADKPAQMPVQVELF